MIKDEQESIEPELKLNQDVLNALAARKQAEQILATSAQIGRQIAMIREPDNLLSTVVSLIAQGFGYETVLLQLLDPAGQKLICHAAGREAGWFRTGRAKLPLQSLAWSAVRTGVTQISLEREPGIEPLLPALPEIRSELEVPLKFGDRVIGVLSLLSRSAYAFNQFDILAVEALSSQLAMAIENTRLFQAEQRQREVAVILAEISGLVNRNLSRTELLNQLLFSLQVLVSYDSAAIFLIEGQEMVVEAGRGFNIDLVGRRFTLEHDSLVREMIARQGAILIEDTRTDERYQRWAGAERVRSWLGTPLRVASALTGCLTVDRHRVEPFTGDEAELVQAFAYQAAQAIYTARLIDRLSAAQAESVERERLAALGQMAATVAHELRNPLMGIRLGVDYLLRELADTHSNRRGAALLESNIERIDRIVEDILFVARAPQSRHQSRALRPIIEQEVARWAARLAEKQIELQLDLADNLPPLQLDADQFGRVLSNLIANSLDALPPGGRLFLGLAADGDNQVLTLVDNGPGIQPGRLPYLFEPFYTTKTRGIGLGLSIVKQVVEQHRGQINISSENGKGVRVTITLPPAITHGEESSEKTHDL